jgi:tetratricopeptide (TPR) repeat protein
MLLQPRNMSPIDLNIKRMISKTPTNPRSHSPSLKKKFTPNVNKSFTCYKDKIPNKHQRTYSLDKNKETSTIHRSKYRSIKTNPRALSQTKDSTFEIAKLEIKNNNYRKAIEILNHLELPETENLEVVYNRGVCYMHLGQYKLAINDFVFVIETDPVFDKQVYIALYMCYMSCDQFLLALRSLSKALKKFPNFVQGFILRGQLLDKLKKHEKALRDFKRAIVLDKHQYLAYLYMAESFIAIQDWESALKVLVHCVSKPETVKKALILKIKVLYELKSFEEALIDTDKLINNWPEEIVAFYYKAKITLDQKKYSESALFFEQVIKGIDDAEMINSSLFYLGTIKIKERDFYGALHTFDRLIKSSITPDQKALHLYTEGVICLMKRKLDEGISIFNNLLKMNEPVLKELIGNCYENLGFAYFSLGKYEKALSMFNQGKKHLKLDKSSEFNSIISEAILSQANKNDKKALKLLKSCKSIFPKNPMPELCRACILMQYSFKSQENISMLMKSEAIIDEVSKSREPESEILFYKSILKFCLKNYDSAFENAKKAIEKADENLYKHYVQRAFCNAVLKKYDDAVQDFTIALQLEEDLKEVYILRGISSYLQDDLQSAFDDFVTVSKKYPTDLFLQVRLSKLFLIIGSHKESISILEEKYPAYHSFEIECVKAHNYIYLQNYPKALDILNGVLKNDEKNKLVHTDKEIIELLFKISQDSSLVFNSISFCSRFKDQVGEIFNKKYLYWLIGILMFYSKDYNAASNYFQGVLQILHSEEPEIFADSITIEEENCEILYNLGLCSFVSDKDGNSSHALMIFEELAEVLNTKHKGQLLFLSALIEISNKNKAKAEKLIKDALKCDNETVSLFLSHSPTTVLPLHTSSEFANIFPLVPVTIENLPTVYIRPSIVLPRVNLDINLEKVLVQVSSLYNLNNLTPRPEAPWLIRNNGSIQFTESILEVKDERIDTEKSVEKDLREDASSEQDKNFVNKSKVRVSKSQAIVRDKTFNTEMSDVVQSLSSKESDDELEQKIKIFCNE